MALAITGIPSLLPQKPQFSCEHLQHAASVNPSRKCSRFPCIHCNAQTSDDGPAPPSQSWIQDEARGDSYAGWSFLNNNGKRKKLTGFLQVGAGMALAVGFALVSHACSKRGVGVMAPVTAVYEETFAPTAKESAKSEETKPVQDQEEEDASKKFEDEEDRTWNVQSKEQEGADEAAPTSHQPDTSTGQVSYPSDEIEDLSDDGVSSSASAGAASTFGNNSTGEGLSYADTEPVVNASDNLVEEPASPADLPVNASASDEIGEELSPAADTTVNTVSDDPIASESSPDIIPESTDIIPKSNPESVDPLPETYPEDGSKTDLEPESIPTDGSELPVDLSSPPKEFADVPEVGTPTLLASVGVLEATSDAEVFEVDTEAAAKLNEEIEVVVSLISSDGPSQDESSPSKVGATPAESAADLVAPDADEISRITSTIDKVSPSSESEIWSFTSVVIPAPSAPSALASGRVLIPPVVDHGQEQAVAALQSLKILEPGIQAQEICTRREYARWLVAANRTLARNSAAKVLPAMYIENVTEIAFDDVTPSDPDFPFIQGLAEAGLISSKLSQDAPDGETVNFLPDRPLSRQDLISWKLAVEHRSLPSVDRNSLQERTGFIDVDQIHKDAWPSVAADFLAGDRSIIASAFGYTKRFQPHKPVTAGQAAVALVYGDASEHVSEELERLEAERLAEKAVAAEIDLEARAQKEASAIFQEELEHQRQLTAKAEAAVESLRTELEQLKTEREEERLSIMKERASLEAAKETLAQSRAELESLLQELSSEKVKVVFERDRVERLLAEIEEERNTLENVKSETEVEKKALSLARLWAEEEAKKARAHAKILEEARKRWEAQGIEVHVDKELADSNIPVPTWQFNGEKFELEEGQAQAQPKAPMHQQIMIKADEYKGKSAQFFKQALDMSNQKLSAAQKQILTSLQNITRKAQEIQQTTFFVVKQKAVEVQGAAASMASGFSTLVAQNTHKLADGCKGGAEKLAQIFKS